VTRFWSAPTCRQHRRDRSRRTKAVTGHRTPKHSITIPRRRLLLCLRFNEELKNNDQSALPQFSNQSAAGWIALFLRHFTQREGSSRTNRREARPDLYSLRKDSSAESRADILSRTARCRRHLQTEPRQTFGNLHWTGASRSRRAGSYSKTASGNH